MKKLLAILIIVALILPLSPIFISAEDGCTTDADCSGQCYCTTTEEASGICAPKDTTVFCPPTSHRSIAGLIDSMLKWVTYIALALVPLMIAIGAFMITTAAGDPDRVDMGKKIIMWTIIGMVIVLFARGLASFVISVIS